MCLNFVVFQIATAMCVNNNNNNNDNNNNNNNNNDNKIYLGTVVHKINHLFTMKHKTIDKKIMTMITTKQFRNDLKVL